MAVDPQRAVEMGLEALEWKEQRERILDREQIRKAYQTANLDEWTTDAQALVSRDIDRYVLDRATDVMARARALPGPEGRALIAQEAAEINAALEGLESQLKQSAAELGLPVPQEKINSILATQRNIVALMNEDADPAKMETRLHGMQDNFVQDTLRSLPREVRDYTARVQIMTDAINVGC